MEKSKHIVIKIKNDSCTITDADLWTNINPIYINEYLWIENNYKPLVRIKIFHSDKFIYLYYHVEEKIISVKHTQFGSPVYKDSCVEFFINPFPKSSNEYVNIEFNALGIMLIGIGESRDKRYFFQKEEINDFTVLTTIKKPIEGLHGKDYWELYTKIPKTFFETYYKKPFIEINSIANFYKCGDETIYKHYGAWNNILNPTPNFHLPKYFGQLTFAE